MSIILPRVLLVLGIEICPGVPRGPQHNNVLYGNDIRAHKVRIGIPLAFVTI